MEARTLISNMRDVIIKGDQLYRMAISRTSRNMIIRDRAAITSKVDTMYAQNLPPFHIDSKHVRFINIYAVHTCCKLAVRLKEGMGMRTSTTTLVWRLASATGSNRILLFLIGEGHHW